jgi:hypothetical protein
VLGDLLILNTGSERAHTLGVRIDDKMTGDITESHVLWDREKRNASESAPVLVDGILYQTTRGGIVSASRPKLARISGRTAWKGQHLPCPVVVGDKLLFSNDRGQTFIVRASPKSSNWSGKTRWPSPSRPPPWWLTEPCSCGRKARSTRLRQSREFPNQRTVNLCDSWHFGHAVVHTGIGLEQFIRGQAEISRAHAGVGEKSAGTHKTVAKTW